eukprot:255074_1
MSKAICEEKLLCVLFNGVYRAMFNEHNYLKQWANDTNLILAPDAKAFREMLEFTLQNKDKNYSNAMKALKAYPFTVTCESKVEYNAQQHNKIYIDNATIIGSLDPNSVVGSLEVRQEFVSSISINDPIGAKIQVYSGTMSSPESDDYAVWVKELAKDNLNKLQQNIVTEKYKNDVTLYVISKELATESREVSEKLYENAYIKLLHFINRFYKIPWSVCLNERLYNSDMTMKVYMEIVKNFCGGFSSLYKKLNILTLMQEFENVIICRQKNGFNYDTDLQTTNKFQIIGYKCILGELKCRTCNYTPVKDQDQTLWSKEYKRIRTEDRTKNMNKLMRMMDWGNRNSGKILRTNKKQIKKFVKIAWYEEANLGETVYADWDNPVDTKYTMNEFIAFALTCIKDEKWKPMLEKKYYV